MGGRGSSSGAGVRGKKDTAPKNQGAIYGGEKGYFTQQGISELEKLGAKRWTKGEKDRLYIDGLAESVGGLEVERYKTGNISSATLNGESISNSDAGRALNYVKGNYVDLATGSIYTSTLTSSNDVVNAVNDNIVKYVKSKRYKKK